MCFEPIFLWYTYGFEYLEFDRLMASLLWPFFVPFLDSILCEFCWYWLFLALVGFRVPLASNLFYAFCPYFDWSLFLNWDVELLLYIFWFFVEWDWIESGLWSTSYLPEFILRPFAKDLVDLCDVSLFSPSFLESLASLEISVFFILRDVLTSPSIILLVWETLLSANNLIFPSSLFWAEMKCLTFPYFWFGSLLEFLTSFWQL